MRTGVRVRAASFEESAEERKNPCRGFYCIRDFRITDEKERPDDLQTAADRHRKDQNRDLILIRISLQDYRERAISGTGLCQVRALFQALEDTDRQLIVRFAYDQEGRNLRQEPSDIRIILEHMRQLGPVLREHAHQIFTLQGLFTGNWGEMHGTRYDTQEDMRRLARQLAEVTEESVYLAVRTPAQWRMITQTADPSKRSGCLERRLGLFNDGMLGSGTDYGTYGIWDAGRTERYEKWNREEELRFQSRLCSRVPNGGEVILPNRYNDLDQAIGAMRAMHVTYLNRDHDRRVFEKWAKSSVHADGCFDGMDGCTYMERHLGYRLLIVRVDFLYRSLGKRLLADITFKNAGFAPMYRRTAAELFLCRAGEVIRRKQMDPGLQKLAGGKESYALLKVRIGLGLTGVASGIYELYLRITDFFTGRPIHLANVQEEGKYGYRVGEITYEQRGEER